MTAAERATVVEELAALLGADAVLTEPHELARYEQGWRYGHGKALAAVRPSSTEDVGRVLAFATAEGIRVVPQGANTGLVGASTPDASGAMLVLSLERLSRTLKEQVVHGRIFQTIDEVRDAVRAFVARYNAEWLIEKNGHRSPDAMRAAWYDQTFRRAA